MAEAPTIALVARSEGGQERVSLPRRAAAQVGRALLGGPERGAQPREDTVLCPRLPPPGEAILGKTLVQRTCLSAALRIADLLQLRRAHGEHGHPPEEAESR